MIEILMVVAIWSVIGLFLGNNPVINDAPLWVWLFVSGPAVWVIYIFLVAGFTTKKLFNKIQGK
jgi:hypothetical protein